MCWATGHYCATRALGDGRRGLFRGADATRDQSYFLFGTTSAQLDMIRFPLGDLPKTRVREMARAQGLVNADKPDSQDICFVPTGRYGDMVAKLRPEAIVPGAIVDEAGAVLGRHDGIVNFTVGQRKGLMGGASAPLYVLRIDAPNARVVVGPREALATSRLALAGHQLARRRHARRPAAARARPACPHALRRAPPCRRRFTAMRR